MQGNCESSSQQEIQHDFGKKKEYTYNLIGSYSEMWWWDVKSGKFNMRRNIRQILLIIRWH